MRLLRALKNLLSDVDENMFTSIVVFSKRCTLKVKSTSVKVINRDDLFSVMNRQIKEETRRIPIDKIEEIYMKLKEYSNLDDAAKVEHIKNIKRNYYFENSFQEYKLLRARIITGRQKGE